jgi:hypothetical protein
VTRRKRRATRRKRRATRRKRRRRLVKVKTLT